jgi:hypothetical protein
MERLFVIWLLIGEQAESLDRGVTGFTSGIKLESATSRPPAWGEIDVRAI